MRLDVVFTTSGSQGTLCGVSVTFSLAVLLEGVLNGDLLVHEVLTVHVCDSIVRGFEGCERNESVALCEVGVVAGHLEYCQWIEKADQWQGDIPLAQRSSCRSD